MLIYLQIINWRSIHWKYFSWVYPKNIFWCRAHNRTSPFEMLQNEAHVFLMWTVLHTWSTPPACLHCEQYLPWFHQHVRWNCTIQIAILAVITSSRSLHIHTWWTLTCRPTSILWWTPSCGHHIDFWTCNWAAEHWTSTLPDLDVFTVSVDGRKLCDAEHRALSEHTPTVSGLHWPLVTASPVLYSAHAVLVNNGVSLK